jgi:hypothetical protein
VARGAAGRADVFPSRHEAGYGAIAAASGGTSPSWPTISGSQWTDSTRIHNHELEFDNPVVMSLAGNKAALPAAWRRGLAIPAYEVFLLTGSSRRASFARIRAAVS